MSLRSNAGNTADNARYSIKGERDIRSEINCIREEGAKVGKTEDEIYSEINKAIWPQYQEMLTSWQNERSERSAVPQKNEEPRVSQPVYTEQERTKKWWQFWK